MGETETPDFLYRPFVTINHRSCQVAAILRYVLKYIFLVPKTLLLEVSSNPIDLHYDC